MFFPERIVSIGPDDRVLEIGPGGAPFHRADVLLEKRFDSEQEATAQRGHAPQLTTDKEVIYYDNGPFPFADGEFDYVICSHVLEHIAPADVPFFLAEISRVGGRGYMEFPTGYYDYLYDFDEHLSLLFYDPTAGEIRYLGKDGSGLLFDTPMQHFFRASLENGYQAVIAELREAFIHGFEWQGAIPCRLATDVADVTYNLTDGFPQPPAAPARPMGWFGRMGQRIDRALSAGPSD